MKTIISLIFLVSYMIFPINSLAEIFDLCPVCTVKGELLCPSGYEAACEQDDTEIHEPKCIFYGNRYVSGCLKFVGVNKLDLNFDTLLPGSKVELIGGGETYTLNRETVGCRRL
ncbi:MAG: hypothetical protein HYR97_02630 [Candidatus Melainabacteria bacterium]|nr:hypothetical protein [Candidatus Melainabacteria bacterium]MBI3309606.1 hypothetical protein [Candidatus Melainabacteria bacterium]